MSDIYNLLANEYKDKMLHPVPRADVVDRVAYILKHTRGKTVLDIGASGPLHEAIKVVSKKVYGIDINAPDGCNYYKIDIDKADWLPDLDVDVVIAGEVIEHVDNAGHFLGLLKKYTCPKILTTPNAFSRAAWANIQTGVESVNPDHKCWYSYTTLKLMLDKYGYNVKEFHWYNGKPFTAEGMVFLLE